jgi:peptidyl-prolyl cis-trans isomerase D
MYELSMEAPVSDPVQTGFGWHVIELKGIREAAGMSFEEARDTLVRENEEENRARMFLEQADRLVDLIYEDPTTLENAASVMELPVQVAGPFPRSGGEGIAATPEVVEAAFSDLVLLQGSVSDPINLDDNRLVMIKLMEHLPVALKPVLEVRDEIIATLRDNLARDSAKAKANDLLAASQSGAGELETLATEAGLEYAHHELVKRNAFTPDAMLVQEIFRLPQPAGDARVEAVLPTSNGFAVVQLESVVQGSIENDALMTQQQYERVIANGNASQENSALMAQLRAAAKVEVFEDRIK